MVLVSIIDFGNVFGRGLGLVFGHVFVRCVGVRIVLPTGHVFGIVLGLVMCFIVVVSSFYFLFIVHGAVRGLVFGIVAGLVFGVGLKRGLVMGSCSLSV